MTTCCKLQSKSTKSTNENCQRELPIIDSLYSVSCKLIREKISKKKRSYQKNHFNKMVTSSTNTSQIMYSKLSHDVPRPRFVLDSTIHIVDRHDPADSVLNSTKGNRAEQLLCDHATLLLSIADIAQSEITQCPSALLEDDSNVSVVEASHHHRRITPSSLPTFPKQLDGDAYLMGSKPNLSLLPRNESLRHSMLIGSRSQRHRSVSFDSPTSVMKNIILHPWESTTSPVTSPLSLPSAPKHCRTPRLDEQEKVTTPKRSNKSICQSSQAAKKARIDSPRCGNTSSIDHNSRNKKLLPQVSTFLLSPKITSPVTHTTNVTTVTNHQPLQKMPPTGTAIRKVYRRKFSWKNYPQVCVLIV